MGRSCKMAAAARFAQRTCQRRLQRTWRNHNEAAAQQWKGQAALDMLTFRSKATSLGCLVAAGAASPAARRELSESKRRPGRLKRRKATRINLHLDDAHYEVVIREARTEPKPPGRYDRRRTSNGFEST